MTVPNGKEEDAMLVKRICRGAFDKENPRRRIETLVRADQVKQDFYTILKSGRLLDDVYAVGMRMDAFFVRRGRLF